MGKPIAASRPSSAGCALLWALLTAWLASSCAEATLSQARHAYAVGDLRRAERTLERLAEERAAAGQSVSPPVEKLLQRVRVEREQVLPQLERRARELAQQAQAGAVSMDHAMQWLLAAQALTQLGTPAYERLQRHIDALEQRRTEHRRVYWQAHRALSQGEQVCQPSKQKQALKGLLEKARPIGNGLHVIDLARAVAQRCFEDRHYEASRELLLWALRQRSPHTRLQPLDMARLALARERGGLEARAETKEALSERKRRRRRLRQRQRRRKKLRNKQQREAAASGQPAANKGEDELSRVEVRLEEIRALFGAGQRFEALQALEAAIETLGDKEGLDVKPLLEQRKAWSAARRELIEAYLARGEKALRAEKPERAYAWYERILQLAPDHDVARDRLRKLRALRRLRGGS